MVNEVGEHSSQKGDCNAGGGHGGERHPDAGKKIIQGQPFMVLEFTPADGKPLMCAIIIDASELKVSDVTVFKPLSEDAEDVCGEEMKVLHEEIDTMKDEHSNGAYRMFPFWLTFNFNGVEVPIFVTCITNGIIISQLLTNMLSKMDDLCLFDRSNGINLFLLCDGHIIRFEEPFIEYTLESNMPWTCCIGCHMG
jgi:hypothetical protein